MNRMYANIVLREVTGKSYVLNEDNEVLDRMATQLEKVYQAGVDSANQDVVPSRVRRLWNDCDVKLHHMSLIGIRVLELRDRESGNSQWMALRFRDESQDNWDFGSYCSAPEAAVVEAIAMRNGPDRAIDGEYANKLLELE